MTSNGIQVSCRVRQDCQSITEHWPPCVNVDTSARRLVVARPSTPTTNMTNSASSLITADNELASGGMAYSCFDGVYSSRATQQEIFVSVGQPFVADLLAGYNCTIIAYGQTGSGKTYTIVGEHTVETRGLVPRVMESILDEMVSTDPAEYDVSLTASFVEVYQERLRDLLLPNSMRVLRLREDKDHDVRVEGASEIAISSVASGMAILSRGNAQRSTGSTLMNVDSSRSHSVLILNFTKKHIAVGTKVKSRMCIVDLAGSEKVQKTAASGVRMEEAKYINRSLSALGNVINALTNEKSKHIPYRDSKLTRLLQTSLGGNAKTHLLLTCSASTQHMDETLSTLRFGSRAKNIQNSPHINKENVGRAAEYNEVLTMLQSKIENLHCYIRQLEASRCSACKSGGSLLVVESRLQQPHQDVTVAELQTSEATPEVISSHDEDAYIDDPIADELMRAEMQCLRKTITNMMRDHEVQEHANYVARTMMEMAEQQLDCRHRSQERTIQQQKVDLKDAHSTIARLEKKLGILEENARDINAELHRFRAQQRQQQAGENAEAEILRRQLEISERQSKQLQAKLTGSRREQEELIADLRARLAAREQEVNSLHCEMDTLRAKKLSVTVPNPVPVRLPSPHRLAHARPVTAIDFKVSRDEVHNNAGSTTIHNWWSGPIADLPGRNQDESAAWMERCVLSPTESPKGLKAHRGEDSFECGANNDRDDTLPPAENAINRVCNSASSTTRPFRARLVGLLNSLEEETTAYRELVVETKERAVSRSSVRPRPHLPGLDVSAPNVPSPTR